MHAAWALSLVSSVTSSIMSSSQRPEKKLNLLNELGKSDKMRGLPSSLSLFRNEFNKFNNTRARMLDSIYHMTTTLNSDFWCKIVIILSLCTQRCCGRHNVSRKSINH